MLVLTESFVFGRAARLVLLCALIVPALAACGGSGGVGSSGVKRAAFTSKEFGVASSPRVTTTKFPPRGGGRELPLKPYKVAGKTYQPVAGPGYVERGHASWYGQDFHGRSTANGEIFGAYYLTAASPVLPIPSYARVTNLENGRSVLVRINDRGPYLQGRVIDLSYQAASVLGYVEQGSAQVEVRYVGPAPLNGDDTKMLTASINKLTRLEQQQDTRLAMAPQSDAGFDSTQVADSGRINLADYQEGRAASSRRNVVGDFFDLFGYADADPVNAAHAAANAMASRDTGLTEWVSAVDADARDIELRLGVFRNQEQAQRIAEAFAMIGAVAEERIEVSGSPATALTLVHLKPGVQRADVLVIAGELGLTDLILY